MERENGFTFPFKIFEGYDLKKASDRTSFRKDEFLTEEVMLHKNVSLITSGIVILFWKKEDGTRTIIDFKSTGDVLRPAVEVSENKIGKIYAQAHTDVEVTLLDRKFLCSCTTESVPITDFFLGVLINDISSTYRQLKLLKVADLKERYLTFLDEYKHIYNEITDRMIASYLGVHYTTLSRVKAKILEDEKSSTFSDKNGG